MSEVRRVCGPYRLSDQSWRLIFKHVDGTRSSSYYKTEEEALSAIEDAERSVSARVGVDALVAGLLAQAVPCPADPAWIYFLRDETGLIVYVGVTGKIGTRLGNHTEDGKSFSAVSIVPAVFDRPVALEMERMLVRTLRPKLNSHHNPDQDATELGACAGVQLDETENDAS